MTIETVEYILFSITSSIIQCDILSVMKMIWFVLFSAFLWSVVDGPVQASTFDDFDPTKEYVVHDVPVIIDEPGKLQLHRNLTNEKPGTSQLDVNPFGKQVGNGTSVFSFSHSITQPLDYSTKQRVASLQSATVGAKQHKQSFSSRLQNAAHGFFRSAQAVISDTVVNPIRSRAQKVFAIPKILTDELFSGFKKISDTIIRWVPIGQWLDGVTMTSWLDPVSAQIVSFFSILKNNVGGIGTLFQHFFQELHWMKDQSFASIAHWFSRLSLRVKVVSTLLMLVSPFLMAKIKNTFEYQQLKFFKDTVLSGGDLILHTASGLAAIVQLALYHQSFSSSYQANNLWIKLHLHRDIGDVKVDLTQVGTAVTMVVALIAIVVIGPIVIGEAVASAKTIAQETPPELVLRSNLAVQKTAQDCANIPGQCDSAGAAGLTFGSNFLFGVAPVIEDETLHGEKIIAETAEQNLKKITLNDKEFTLTEHAVQQMKARSVSEAEVLKTLEVQPFPYYHDNTWKQGYYDPQSKIFVGVGDNITTVINNAKPQYITNLKSAKP